jgi:casein kinase 1
MIHNCGLIYRDIKPDNFLIGANNLLYIVDFGMAKAYLDPRTLQHIPYRERKSLSGTARYMSINTHLGREQSRRDDLEALGHVFFYFLRGSLPWQGLTAASNKEKYEKIGMKKQDISVSELCNGLPDEFSKYLQYARNLKFDAVPNYNWLRGLMGNVMSRYGPIYYFKYDWSQYRSTWEPELLEKVSESELNCLKADAIKLGASSPLSPCSIESNYLCPYSPGATATEAAPSMQPAHRSVAIFKDNTDNNDQFPYPMRPNRPPHDNYQEENSNGRRSWLRKLFCL